MSHPSAAAADPQIVPPQLVPTSFTITHADGPQGRKVVLSVNHPSGVSVFFLDPEPAQQIGGQLRAAGKQAASGLIVPPSGMAL